MANYNRRDDDLAYGDYNDQGEGEDGERGFIGDVGKRIFGRKPQQGQQPGSSGQKPASGASFIFDKLHDAMHQIGSEVKEKISGQGRPGSQQQQGGFSAATAGPNSSHRFQSFAPERSGNDIKWYVDGCGYMWAVSVALEQARESIWILDWWLSPELYLRRPPAKNEQYRVDRMLLAAAQRGVKINIMVYKEVTQALTRKFLNPTLPDYIHSLLPHTTDHATRLLSRLGLDVIFKSLEEWEDTDPLIPPPISVSSSHTKHALESLHPNIAVFRHPDHLPDGKVVASNILTSLQNFKLNAASAAQLPGDSIKALYGVHEDTVLYWAHHEKLCLVDGRIAFMGGLDLCYGRWDTNQHSISDAHPGDLSQIVFPGQDYNNARIMDFQDVVHWENNKLDRTKSSRMGWSDVSLCVSGPAVRDLQTHFVQRWNFIYDEKYSHKDVRYSRLPDPGSAGFTYGQPPGQQTQQPGGSSYGQSTQQPQSYGASPPQQGQGQYFPPPPTQGRRGINEEQEGSRSIEEGERGFGEDGEGNRGLFGHKNQFMQEINQEVQQLQGHYGHHGHHSSHQGSGGVSCQITRSSSKWSHNITTEHSIQNAYCEVIRASEHFVYIENQFFITATGDKQKPVKNQIGAAIVERILRAARNGEKYHMIVLMPAVPAFAGDLRADDALGTRAIMEFQYNSINRGGNSIYECIAREGVNPMEYIRFYNLRNYDRINASGVMAQVEQQTGVPYEDARKQHDAIYGGGYQNDSPGYQSQPEVYQPPPASYQSQPEVYHPPPASYQSEPASQQYQPYHPAPGLGSEYSQAASPPQQQGGYQPYHPPGYEPNPNQIYEMDAGSGQPQSRGIDPGAQYQQYQQYQQGAQQTGERKGLGSGRWDSVAECYMLGGEDIRNVPWEGGGMDEIDAFVSEELYIHSKLLIADDRIVICGSANLNDRSQVGDHDSEIAIIVNDFTPVESSMNGQPWRASKFAAGLRRQLFRKHLGLLRPQDMTKPDANFQPVGVPNTYDWGSPEDNLVRDPLAGGFLNFWNSRARANTDAFARVFHPVPFDGVRTWKQYDEYYERFFKEEGEKDHKRPSKYAWGHVVREDFRDVGEVKEVLSQIKGNLVEMPLLFLKDEDIAKEGLGLNAFTEEVYT